MLTTTTAATSYHLIQIDCQTHCSKPNAGNSFAVDSDYLLDSNYLTQLPQTFKHRVIQADHCTFHLLLRQHDVGETVALVDI